MKIWNRIAWEWKEKRRYAHIPASRYKQGFSQEVVQPLSIFHLSYFLFLCINHKMLIQITLLVLQPRT